jgi:hypothetical protein
MAFQKTAKLMVNRLSNALLNDRISQPIGQLDYEYSDGDFSGLAYLPNVDVLQTQEDVENAYNILVKVRPEIYQYLENNTVFSLEDLILAEAYLDGEEDDEDDDDDEEYDESYADEEEGIPEPILMLKEIIEESYTSGIDGLFTEDLEPISQDNLYLYDEDTNSFMGLFTDGDKIFSFDLVDTDGEDGWELSYLDVSADYE